MRGWSGLIGGKKMVGQSELAHGKVILEKIISMLVGLIRSNSADRLPESPVPYHTKSKKD
jgi:hypothetical protein